jgi:hypothetical protein
MDGFTAAFGTLAGWELGNSKPAVIWILKD